MRSAVLIVDVPAPRPIRSSRHLTAQERSKGMTFISPRETEGDYSTPVFQSIVTETSNITILCYAIYTTMGVPAI